MADRLRLTAPLPSLDAWVNAFAQAEIPVLTETAEALEHMRATEDDVDAHGLGEMIATDPLMTLKVLAHASEQRRGRSSEMRADPETVTAALVLMGITPFFRDFGPQPTLESALAGNDAALLGLSRVMQRAERASRYALGFAAHRADPDAAIIHSAALLHDFAEMLLWCHAPELALRIRQAQESDPTLRSSVIQKDVLNVTLPELQQSLMRAWRLPELLTRITDDRHAEHPSAKNVVLAIRLARHTAKGWDNAALPDDIKDIASLLNLSEAATAEIVRDLDS